MSSAEASRHFEPVVAETHGAPPTPQRAEVTIGPDINRLLGGTDEPAHGDSKTLTFSTTLNATDGTPLAALNNVSTTVTRMTVPATGRPFLNFYLTYYATSLGWRTGSGLGEDQRPLHGLYFKNAQHGVMYSWGFPAQDFEIECGWNNQFRLYHWTEQNFVSWFDEWEHIHYDVQGSFYPC
jgi:hypothetical protein